MSETREEGLSALLHETRTFAPPEELAKEPEDPQAITMAAADPVSVEAPVAETE